MPKWLRRLLFQVVLTAALATALSGTFDAERQRTNGAAPAFAPNYSQSLRVMSFNIRVHTESDGNNDWNHRRDTVAGVLRFYQADIACLQEAYAGMIEDLAIRLPDHAWYGVGSSDGERGGAHNPVFYRASRFRLISSETFWLSSTPAKPGLGWDAAFVRAVTHIELMDLYSGRALHVFNVHLDHEGKRAREESAELVRDRVARVSGEVVVAGDFNSTRQEQPWRTLTEGGLRDTRHASLTGHFGLSTTFNDFETSWRPDYAIDFILVSSGIIVQQEGVPCTLFDGRHASDHFPVLAEIR